MVAKQQLLFTNYMQMFESADLRPLHRNKLQHFVSRLVALAKYRFSIPYYVRLGEDALRKKVSSGTLFIFGCGRSINDITADEWRNIACYNTLSLSYFIYCQKVRIDFQFTRDIVQFHDGKQTAKALAYFGQLFALNPCCQKAVFCFQDEFKAIGTRSALFARTMPRNTEIFGWRTKSRGVLEPPSQNFKDGLVHGPATLLDAINFAYILGYKRIVLAGVDLYDKRYFFIDGDGLDPSSIQNHGTKSADEPHNTIRFGLLRYIAAWNDKFKHEGIELYAYNPQSLLTEVLPVFDQDKFAT